MLFAWQELAATSQEGASGPQGPHLLHPSCCVLVPECTPGGSSTYGTRAQGSRQGQTRGPGVWWEGHLHSGLSYPNSHQAKFPVKKMIGLPFF